MLGALLGLSHSEHISVSLALEALDGFTGFSYMLMPTIWLRKRWLPAAGLKISAQIIQRMAEKRSRVSS